MAEDVSLGASVLAFITITAKLSKATTTLFGSFRGAPSDVKRVETRLKDLDFILTQIDRTRSINPGCAEDPATKIYWNDKRAKLKSDFEEFEKFTAQLGANIGGMKGRIKWFLTDEDCAKKVLGLLAEDINVLRTLQLMMESWVSISLNSILTR
jgi:hypothetical protein